MESDYSDDEYAPISLGAWGDQSQRQETSPSQQDPSETGGVKGWSQLIDPDAKALPGSLGSGGLHRKGKNYKPIDEEYIVKQRLKGGGLPKTNNDNKTRGNRSNNDNSKKGKRHTDKPKATTFSTTKRTTFSTPTATPPPPPPLSTIRRPPPPSSGNTGWGAPLVETPFWEKERPKAVDPPPSDNTKGASSSWSNAGVSNNNDVSKLGFDSKKSSPTKTMMPPPGYGPIPTRRQYPVETGKPPPPPPPGFSYAKQQGRSQPPPAPPPGFSYANQQGKPKNENDLDWASGWDKIAPKNNGSPATPPQNEGWGSENGNWASSNFMGNTTPMQFVEEQTNALKSGRFSDPCKTRYSTAEQANAKPLPKNYYRKDGVSRPAFMETPTRVAAPPPSHNPVVLSIHLELENGLKVPISIRKLDDPTTLARSFCQAQNIVNPTLINGIIQFFTQQQSAALKRYK